MYVLELEEDIEVLEEEEPAMEEENTEESNLSPQMSVHALDGTVDYRTMRVKRSIKGKMVHVLVDSGSTHNFMDVNVARKLGIQLETIPSFFVVVANGSRVHNKFMSKKVKWRMQGVDFMADMLVIPLGGADVVLRIQWLITLGDIKWNFRQPKMEFQINGKKISLRGSPPSDSKMVSSQKMQKLLNKPTQLSMMTVTFVKHTAAQTLSLSEMQLGENGKTCPSDLQQIYTRKGRRI